MIGQGQTFLGYRLCVVHDLPKAHVGSILGEARWSKNRSRRLWKKLRKGTHKRSRHVPLMVDQAFISGAQMFVTPAMEHALRQKIESVTRDVFMPWNMP